MKEEYWLWNMLILHTTPKHNGARYCLVHSCDVYLDLHKCHNRGFQTFLQLDPGSLS